MGSYVKIIVMEMLPVVNVASLFAIDELDQHNTAKQLREALCTTGFCYIEGHQVEQSLVDSLLELSREFFLATEEQKQTIHMSKSHKYSFRGYTCLGEEITLGKVDWHECIDFGPHTEPNRPMHGPNLFPHWIPSFKTQVEKMQLAIRELGNVLMQGIAISFGLPKNFWDDYFTAEESFLLARMLHYPPESEKPNFWNGIEVGSGIGPHTDYGCLTILIQDEVGGLQVQTQPGKWIDAPYRPGCFVLNVGDMLMHWTNNQLVSTCHRVLPPAKDRYSIPFFYEPGFETVVSPISSIETKPRPSHISNKYLPKTEPIKYGDYLTQRSSIAFHTHS